MRKPSSSLKYPWHDLFSTRNLRLKASSQTSSLTVLLNTALEKIRLAHAMSTLSLSSLTPENPFIGDLSLGVKMDAKSIGKVFASSYFTILDYGTILGDMVREQKFSYFCICFE